MGVGYEALYNNDPNGITYVSPNYYATDGNQNTAVGDYSLYSNTTGANNVALGYQALYNNQSGYNNVAMGYEAGLNTDLNDNTFLGYQAGIGNQSCGSCITPGGYENTCLGSGANIDNSSGTVVNSAAIGYGAVVNIPNTMVFGNIDIQYLYAYVHMFYPSDGNFKKNIASNVAGLSFINKLKPITYNYDIESLDAHIHGGKIKHSQQDIDAMQAKDKMIYSGFVAQDVDAAAKSVGYDFSGVHSPENDRDIYALSYSDFVVPLVKSVQELSAKNDAKDSAIAQQQQQISAQQTQLTTQQSEIDQLNAMVSKLDVALSVCCNSYQSTTGMPQTGSDNDAPYLNQNFPNPYSQNTTISCYVPITAHNAAIVIYDLNGRELKSLTIPATGYNQVVVTGRTLAAGDYLYTLYVDGQKIDTRKMTLTH